MRAVSLFLLAALSGCTSRTITPAAAEGPRVWFAEVADKSKIAIIVCDAKAVPPCIRFAARDVQTAGEVQRWAEASRSEEAKTKARYVSPPPSAPAPVN
jgi:hypothetical protein